MEAVAAGAFDLRMQRENSSRNSINPSRHRYIKSLENVAARRATENAQDGHIDGSIRIAIRFDTDNLPCGWPSIPNETFAIPSTPV